MCIDFTALVNSSNFPEFPCVDKLLSAERLLELLVKLLVQLNQKAGWNDFSASERAYTCLDTIKLPLSQMVDP